MSRPELDGMYQEILLEHSRDPHNFGTLENPDVVAEGYNPLCGDKVCIHLKLKNDPAPALVRAECVRFKGEACSICMASASIMTDELTGKSLPEVRAMIQSFRDLLQGKKSPEDFEGDVSSLAGVKNFPVRIKCALLPWTTLNEALEKREEVS